MWIDKQLMHNGREYWERYGYQPHDFPHASREGLRVFSLPIYSKMTETDIEDVITATLSIAEQYQR